MTEIIKSEITSKENIEEKRIISYMSNEEFSELMNQRHKEYLAGKGTPVKQAFDELRKKGYPK